MAEMTMRALMSVVALSGWLAFAAVWLQQPRAAPLEAPAYFALQDDGAGHMAAHVRASGQPPVQKPALKDDVIEIDLGKTPKLTGGSFLPPNAKPSGGGSFAAGFPKRWAPPGTHQRSSREVTTLHC